MPTRGPTFPSFTLVLSSKRDSFSLPDYYRTTRLEIYGPYFRPSEPAQDLMRTIDHRGRESDAFDPDFLPPENHERVSERMALDWQSELEDDDVEFVHDLVDVGKRSRISWFGRLISSVLRKCRGHKVSENLGAGI